MYTLCMVPYNTNSPTHDLAVSFYDTGSVEEWLKFQQNLQAVITRQNVTNPQGMYMITKSMLCRDVLTAFENDDQVNRPQLEPNHKQAMEDVHIP
eukprot:9439635-Ditylum_brightwellii.AAC.1